MSKPLCLAALSVAGSGCRSGHREVERSTSLSEPTALLDVPTAYSCLVECVCGLKASEEVGRCLSACAAVEVACCLCADLVFACDGSLAVWCVLVARARCLLGFLAVFVFGLAFVAAAL